MIRYLADTQGGLRHRQGENSLIRDLRGHPLGGVEISELADGIRSTENYDSAMTGQVQMS